jgi:Zn-dependent M28 family amino/carboxypeptidase
VARPVPPDLAVIETNVRRHVDMLAGVLGERNALHCYGALEAAARYVEDTLRAAGYSPRAQEFFVYGKPVRNVDAELPGVTRPKRIWVVGAHYDSVDGSPAADDNASAVAALLEVARLLAARRPRDTVRFAAFVNEEPPFYKGPDMGSLRYAARCRERGERVACMINFEMLGYYTDAPRSQRYPHPLNRAPYKWFLPTRGNFIAFCGDVRSFGMTRRCNRLFRRSVRFPTRWVAAPDRICGHGMSDHWSFWEHGYRAVMVTDTAFFRNPHYHKPSDRPDTLDYPRMATVTEGLAGMIARLAGAK